MDFPVRMSAAPVWPCLGSEREKYAFRSGLKSQKYFFISFNVQPKLPMTTGWLT